MHRYTSSRIDIFNEYTLSFGENITSCSSLCTGTQGKI